MRSRAVLLGALCISGLNAGDIRRPVKALADFSAAIEELAASLSPAVVRINVRARGLVEPGDGRRAGFFGEQRGSGSGVILDPSGYILTNAHVIDGARQIEVSLLDRSFPATVAGVDKETDLAVLKIAAENLTALTFADSGAVRQGQVVLAFGSPLGLENSLSIGFISAPARQLKPDQAMTYIQTDAPINPGNSGGPLLDIEGRIVGINTLILSQSGGNEGIGFAIPANIARRVYEQLRDEGHVHRGAIGIIAQEISPVLAQALGIERRQGAILSDILPHGAAEAAGLEPGDIVLAIDGNPVREARQLIGAAFEFRPGAKIVLDIQRGRETFRKTVAVMKRSGSRGGLADLVNHDSGLIHALGVYAMTLDAKVTPLLPGLRRLDGVVVAAIAAEAASRNPGLQAGDVIYEVNRTRVRSLEELQSELQKKNAGDALALLVEHDGTLGYVSFKLERP